MTRTVFPTIPPRVDYELTELGHSLRSPIEALGDWAFAHIVSGQGEAVYSERCKQRLTRVHP